MTGLYQVGVAFDYPLNVWKIENPPEDWESFPATGDEDSASLAAEVDRLLGIARAGTHYQVLGVPSTANRLELKRKFYQLVRRFHPDHCMDHPEWAPQLQILVDALTTAYKVLSDSDKRKQYDAEIFAPPNQGQPELKRSAQKFLEEAQECLAERNYMGSILWLRRAIENEPASSGYRAMLAQSLAQVPEYRLESVEQFEKAIELDPRNLTAHLGYGQLLERMKLPWRARLHYVRVLELDMNHREARQRLNLLDASSPRHASRPSLLERLARRLSR